MTSSAGLEGDMMRGVGGELYTLVVYIFKGEAGRDFLNHILKYSLIIQCKKACKEFYKTILVLVYKYNKCGLLHVSGKRHQKLFKP